MLYFGIRIVFAFLLIIHGVAHYSITTGWGAKSTAESWLLGGSRAGLATLTSMGNVLSIAALLAFATAGALVGFNQDWWRPVALTATVLSLLVMALFWQSNMIIGIAIDVAIIAAVLWPNSPVVDFTSR